MKSKIALPLLAMVIAAVFLAACGGGSGSGSTTPGPKVTQGVVVDPYIVGASFFEDLNANGIRDAAEQISTLSDEFGAFSFAKALTDGSVLVMLDKGIHSGRTFTGTLKRLLRPGESGTIIVSPLTTLIANGVSPQELCQLLEEAGLLGVVESDLFRNPMAPFENIRPEAVDEAKLKLLQAAVALNSFLSIVGYEADYEDCTTESARALLRNLVAMAKGTLKPEFVKSISDELEAVIGPIDAMGRFPHVTATEACKAAAAVLQSYANKLKTYLDQLPALHPDEIVVLLPPVQRLLEECSLLDLADVSLHFYIDNHRLDPEIDDAIIRGVFRDPLLCRVNLEVNANDTQACAIEAMLICDPGNGGGGGGGGDTDPEPTPEPPPQVAAGWIRNYDSGVSASEDYPVDMFVDSSGAVYVTGVSKGAGIDPDIVTLKYSSQGDLLWSARYNSAVNGFDEAVALAVDGAGNVCVAGTSTKADDSEVFLVLKYDASGNLSWAREYSGVGGFVNQARDIALDSAGNVYVTGLSVGSGFLANSDFATVKYDSAGALVWASRFDGPAGGQDSPEALAVDGQGNVYVAGASQGQGSGLDFATVKYDSAGVLQWVVRYDNGKDDMATAIALGVDGNLFIAGLSFGSGTSSDYAVVSYDSAGNERWAARSNSGGQAQDQPVAIAVDGSGNLFVTGTAGTEIWNANSGYYTVKLDSNGGLQWTARYDGPGNGSDRANGLALDVDGNVYVTGQSKGVDTATDFATVSYNPAGEIRWIERYDGGGGLDDSAAAVGTDAAGNVYVTGSTGLGAQETQITTVKYVP